MFPGVYYEDQFEMYVWMNYSRVGVNIYLQKNLSSF